MIRSTVVSEHDYNINDHNYNNANFFNSKNREDACLWTNQSNLDKIVKGLRSEQGHIPVKLVILNLTDER